MNPHPTALCASKQKSLLSREPEFTAENVLTNAKFDASLVGKDVAELLRLRSPSLRYKLHSHRVQAIQETARLKAWLSVDMSAILHINSNADTRNDQSGSFIMAKLVDSLLERAERSSPSLEIVPLAFFCGQHSNSYVDPVATAQALAENVLLQLNDHHRDFEAADLRECWDQLRNGAVVDTMRALEWMIACLPPMAMVFIIVDGIETFQTPPNRKKETREVLQFLVEIFRRRQDGPGAKVKLLFSTCTACHLMEGLLEDEEVVTIPKTPRPGGHSDTIVNRMLL